MKKVTKEVKTTKATKAKKTFKPAYVVDLVGCYTADDITSAFILGKVKGGIAITEREFFEAASIIVRTLTDIEVKFTMDLFKLLNSHIKLEKPKKTPWYKKLMFWKKNK